MVSEPAKRPLIGIPVESQIDHRRLKVCVENWPGCYEGGYDPSCCRFPKSCSCEVYDPETISEERLEPMPERAIPQIGGERKPQVPTRAIVEQQGERLIERDMRVRSGDYGTGKVIAILAIGVQIWWDEPLIGTTDSHMLVHDWSYVQRLERL